MKTLLFLFFIIFLTSCSNEASANFIKQDYIETVGDNTPVSRAFVAKMLSHIVDDIRTIYSMDIYANFNDVSSDMWYFNYINTVYARNIMRGTGINFEPNEPLTLEKAQIILNNINANINLNITEENKDSPISHALWNRLYIRALQNLSGEETVEQRFGIREQNIIILATEENNPALENGNVITNRGVFSSVGISNRDFLDTEITALTKGQDIITVIDIITNSPILEYVYVINGGDNFTIFKGGVERIFSGENTLSFGDIASIQIQNGVVLEYVLHNNIIQNNTIERVGSNFIEISGYGRIATAENFSVYNQTQNLRWQNRQNLIVGTSIARFIIENDELVAAVITQRPIPRYLRVALNTTNFESLIHNEVTVTSDTYFTITDKNGTTTYSPNEIVTFSTENKIAGYRAHIQPYQGRIQILSIQRAWPSSESPKYYGSIQITYEGTGFSVINIVPLEEYLKSVVPSEMPSSFGVEASMIQAVTARSYAYGQFLANRMSNIGANLEDSVMSQVYNNIPENDVSVEAVRNTVGQILSYNGNVINANFFSTSAGVTANNGDVWANLGRLPSATQPFLTSVRQYLNNDFGDLSNEENARVFFNNLEIESYDDNSPWFRWNVTMTPEQITNSINRELQNRFNTNPFLIKTLMTDGTFKSEPIHTIGEFVNIEVAKRGTGGNIMELVVHGSENTIKIITEFNIRMLLAPRSETEDIILRRWDGTNITNFNMLPSAFFTIERLTNAEGDILEVRFVGGGFGHGVGMSQYGARGMLDRGYNYLQILLHFYTGVDVVTIE
ncbi:MAG: SpoIID/LytB domain-containing protein [Defluviitaleaceae bacterium]|nr:SpoIID/LytB domain-containing protein [Defluviitaleaceae bacterium]